MKKLLFLLIMSGAVTISFGQVPYFIRGTEKTVYREDVNSLKCYVYKDLLVKTGIIEREGKNLNTIQAFARNAILLPKDNCLRSGIPIITYERTGDINFVENSLSGNLLFINLNVAPDSEILLIFDLSSRKKVFENEHTQWRSEMRLSSKRYLLYEKWTKKKGPARNCPSEKKWKQQGLGVDWVQTYRLDLKTMKTVRSGVSRCVSTY